jgi:hypothetical protein
VGQIDGRFGHDGYPELGAHTLPDPPLKPR